MLHAFQDHLNQKFPFLKSKKLLLAVSGGVDSMVLLDLLRTLNYDFAVAHCNFQLRDEASNLDEKLVENYCLKHEIIFFVKRFETIDYAELNKQSIQIAARELRYQWFKELLQINSLDYLITAHHLDDSVETFLINFTRGTGIDGLLGIPEMNENLVRPLLIFSREEIHDYALQNGVKWREDASNATTKYLRNKFRHDIIPVFKNKNEQFLKSYQQTISNLSQSSQLIQDACNLVGEKVFLKSEHLLEIDIEGLKKFPNYNEYLYQWLKKYDFKSWEDIFELVNGSTGKKIYSEGFILLKNRNSLILNKIEVEKKEEIEIFEHEKEILSPISLIFESIIDNETVFNNSNEIVVDADLLKFPLKLRKKEQGDYFYPFGMRGKKKVSKYFKDEKFSMFNKQETWLLVNNNEEIIWIVGSRMDDRFKINNQTNYKLKIKLVK